MITSAIQTLLEMAMRLLFAVIPVRIDKRPQELWKQFQLTRPSQAQVELWARSNPPAWAIITGTVSGVIVLDFDGDEGNATMHGLGLDPHVKTGSGGHHVYSRIPAGTFRPSTARPSGSLGRSSPASIFAVTADTRSLQVGRILESTFGFARWFPTHWIYFPTRCGLLLGSWYHLHL
jgi:hypothetical protein